MSRVFVVVAEGGGIWGRRRGGWDGGHGWDLGNKDFFLF